MAKNPAPRKRTKRARSDSATSKVKAMQNVLQGELQPPEHITLRDCDWPFWCSVVRARARDLWTDSDLEMAANLARCKSDVERLQKEITEEGDTIVNARGTEIVNPKHDLLERLSRRAVALSRMIHVHAEATVGNARDEKNAAENDKEAETLMNNADTSLIATPTNVRH